MPRQRGRLRRSGARPRDRLRRDRADAGARPPARRGEGRRAERRCSARPRRAPLSVRAAALDGGRKAAARIRGDRLLPLRPSARSLRQRAEEASAPSAGRSSRARCAAARPTGKLAASVLDRFERRTKSGAKLGVIQLSDPAASTRRSSSRKGSRSTATCWKKAADVLLTLQANVEGEDVRARIVHAESLAEAAAKTPQGLRIFVRDEAPLASIAERLNGRGDGEISLVVHARPRGRRSRS